MSSTVQSRAEAQVWDVLIVGAGPVGLYAAYYAGFRGLSTVVVDSLDEVGGQITAMYPEKYLYDIAGFPQIRGRDLVGNLAAQAAQFDMPILLDHQVRTVEGELGDFLVTTAPGARIRTRTILLTSGIGTFTPRPSAVGEEFLGRGLSYFVTDPEAIRGKRAVVLGGGDSAVDWALMLEPIAAQVTLVHRRAQFRAHAHSVKLLKDSSVELITGAQVVGACGQHRLEAVEVEHEGRRVRVEADHVVSALGFVADLGPLLDWGLEMRGRHVAVDQTMRTSREGIYAAGDLSDFNGKVRLLSVGFGEAATAVNNLAVRLHPEQSLMPAHSSDKMPGEKA